jgi:hypothetical protein
MVWKESYTNWLSDVSEVINLMYLFYVLYYDICLNWKAVNLNLNDILFVIQNMCYVVFIRPA